MRGVLRQSELQGRVGVIRPFHEEIEPARTRAAPAPPDAGDPERHLRLLGRIAEEMVRERARLLAQIRPGILELALAIAREIIHHEVTADPTVIEQTLAQALQNLHFATKIVARLHPDDLAHLQEHQAAWQQQAAQLEFIADPSIERGGCRLDSDRGGFDATLQTQLATLREALAASYNG